MMLLKDLPKEFRENHIFRYTSGNVEYQCKATYLPFGIREMVKYEGMKLEEIYTPIIHLEWETTNTEKSIYKTAYDEMIGYSALETSYLDRVKEEDRWLNAGVQLNIFNY